jgi:hypothetical protein
MDQWHGLLLLLIQNPIDFDIWGHPNFTVRAAEEGTDVQQLQQRVQHGFELIPTCGLSQRIRQ